MELELADEDERVPSVLIRRFGLTFLPQGATNTTSLSSYKIGESFFHVTVTQAQEMLETSTTKIEEDISSLEDKLNTAREEMTQLKVELYARFGRSINLET